MEGFSKGIVVFHECEDPEINNMFRQECEKLGLSPEEISLLVPEEYETHDFNVLCPAGVSKSYGETYSVRLEIPFREEEQSRMNLLVRMGMSLLHPFYTHEDHVRDNIRHELAHIKLKHCEVKLPKSLEFLYNVLIADPIVEFYNLCRK